MATAPTMLTTFTEVSRHGRLYTGGKVHPSRDGSFLVCPCGAEVNVIDTASGMAVLTVPAEADEFTAFALRDDGKQLVTAGRSRQFRSWTLDVAEKTCTMERVWKGHKLPVLELAYDRSGGLVASASADTTVMVFDVDRGATTHVFRGHTGVVNLVAFHPVQTDGQLLLISAAADNAIKVWDLHAKACKATLSSHVGQPTALAFAPDGLTMLSAGRDQLQIKLFDAGGGMSCALLSAHTDVVLGLDVHVDGQLIASASKDGTARVWKAAAVPDPVAPFRCVAVCEGHVEAVGAVAFAFKAPWLITGSKDKTTKLWDLAPALNGEGAGGEMKASKRPKTGSEGRGVIKARARSSVVGHQKEINALAVAPNDKLCVSASQDRTLRVWSLREGALHPMGVLNGHKRAVWCVAFSPVDKCCASGSGDMLIKVWSMTDYTCLRTFEGHVSSVLRVHFVASGNQVLSSGSDGLVKLWHAKTGECNTTLDAHEDKVWALDVAATAQGGLEVWSGSADSVLVRWQDSSEAVAQEESAARDLQMERETELSIAVHAREFDRAFKLAMRLQQPRHLRTVVERLVGSPEGVGQMNDAVRLMDESDLAYCLSCCRDWNTTATHALTAQKLLHAVLTTTTAAKLATMPKLNEILDALIPYTERHFERLDRLMQQSQFLSFTVAQMRMLETDRHDDAMDGATA